MPEQHLICGIDYSTKALDVALVRGRQLVSLETHRLGVDLDVQVAVMTRLMARLRDQGVAAIVMEQPFIPLNSGRGVATSLKIRQVSTRVEAIAAQAGIKVVWVPVNTWHAAVLGNGRIGSDEAKRASVAYVERVYGRKPDSHNQADAVCLATWGSATVRLELARQVNRR